MNVFFIWIGIPKPHIRHFRLAAGFVLLQIDMSFPERYCVVNIGERILFSPICENKKKTRNAIPYRNLSKIVLSPHIDSTGDRNDVYYVGAF